MSLQPIVAQLGITDENGEIASVKNMSQAEKEILRYIATLKQAQVAMGDLANTVESPSNQLKIFRQQLIETKVALSNLFINTFANILPYANAFLMVIKEISKAIADMFGIKITDFNSGIASQEGIYDGIADSVDNATDSVKELKRQTLGFDEIHNINENQNSGSGSSGGVSGGIDQRLLDAIEGYDNGMEKVRMKATEIRDRIMEWLGFTKKINPLTGETYFEYEGIEKTLKNMWESFKGLSTEGKILVGLGLVVGATKLWNVGKKLVTVFGNSGLGKVLKTALIPFKTLGNNMLNLIQYTRVYTSLTGNMKNGILGGIEAWRKQNIIVKDSYGNTDKLKTAMNGAKVAVQGLITGAVGLYTVNQSMKSLSTEGANLANVLGLVTGSLTTIASGVQIGAIFGPWGAVIGGATGALLSLISALSGYESQAYKNAEATIKNCQAIDEYSNSLLKQYDAIAENLSNQNAISTAHMNLIKELENIVDVNGKVKAGYEERAQFIITTLNNAYGTEMQMVDGVIQKMDEQIAKIRDVIEEKKKEIALESAAQGYETALNAKAKSYANLESAQKKYKDSLEELDKFEKEAIERYKNNEGLFSIAYGSQEKYLEYVKSTSKEYKKLIEATDTAKSSIEKATKAYDANTNAIMNYEGLITSNSAENAEAVEYYMTQIENSYYDGENFIKLTYSQQIKDAQEYYNSVIRMAKENGQEISDEIKAQANSRLNTVSKSLIEQSQTVENMTEETTRAWSLLANTNREAYNSALSKLPSDVRNQLNNLEGSVNNSLGYGSRVYNAFGSVGANLGQVLGNSISNNMKINGNTLNSTWNSATSKIGEKLKQLAGIGMAGLGISLKISGYANGGFPEDGWFRASHGEIMGKFDNGKSVVANNMQITQGIEEAAYRGYMRAISESGMGVRQANEIDVHVHTDEGTVIDRIEQRTKQTGKFPFTIPTY